MRYLILFLVMLSATACLQKHGLYNNPYPEMQPVDVYKPKAADRAPGSLFDKTGGTTNMISDARAFRVNDIVIINIAESMTATNSANTATDREGSNSFKIPNLLGIETKNAAYFGGSSDGTVLGTESKSSHAGTGTTARSDVFSGTVAARVIDVLPNGYLVIQGQKNVQVNDEKVRFYLTGMVNPLMIGSDHSVASTQVADMELRYGGNGVVSAKQSPGMFSRVLNWLWPF